jgi:hypothetical protein
MAINHNKPMPQFELNGAKINEVSTIKYLGIEIEKCLGWKEYAQKRRRSALQAWHSLYRIGINTSWMTASTKDLLYRTYVRPVLTYGLENVRLNDQEIRILQLTESNIAKSICGVSKNQNQQSCSQRWA